MLYSDGVLQLLRCYCIFQQFHTTFVINRTVYPLVRKGFYFKSIFLFSFQLVLAFLHVSVKKRNAKRSHTPGKLLVLVNIQFLKKKRKIVVQINMENSSIRKAQLSGNRPSKLKSEYITLILKSP